MTTKHDLSNVIFAVSAALQRGEPVSHVALRYDVSPAEALKWHRDLVQAASKLASPSEHDLVSGMAEVIAENSSQAVAVINDKGHCIYVNRAFVDIFGYSKDELYQSPLHDLIHYRRSDGSQYPPEDCPLVAASVEQTQLSRLEDLFFKKDGSPVRVICEASPVKDILGRRHLVLEVRDITQEVAIQSSLSAHQKRLEALFSTNLIGVIYWTLDGEIEEANDEFLRIVKYTRDDLSCHRIDWKEITPAEFRDSDAVAVAQLLASGAHPTIEKQYKCKDGTLVWVAVTSALIDGSNGVGFVQDISSRKSAEVRLLNAQQKALEEAAKFQEAKARLAALLEAAPVGIGMCDATGRIIEVNRGNRLLWGDDLPYSENVEAYREWNGWWADGSEKHGKRIEPHEWALARALMGEEAPRDLIEIEPFNAPGTRKRVLNCGTAVRNQNGEIVGAVVAQMDITDLVKTEDALRDSELKFRTITDAMPQMVFSSLPGGYNDYQNKHLYDFTGAEPGSLEGEAWLSVVHPMDVPNCMQLWSHSLATGEPYEIKYRIRHRSGEYRWALSRALPIKNSDGNIIRWLGTCTDIHEQVLIQEALEDADRKKDDFIALLAHELRNPLAPVRTALDLFKLHPPANGTLKRAAEIMDRQVKQMSSLIDDLLDVARITRGKVSLKLQQCDLSSILEEVCDDHRTPMTKNDIELTLDLPTEPILVLGDVVRLTQVFGNLLHNACKYSNPGGAVDVKAEVSSEPNGAHVVNIYVRDNGLGLTEDLLARLFKPFTQAEERSDKLNGGLGLGLAIVKGLVELHGGGVSATSPGIGHGATFTVTLPLAMSNEVKPVQEGSMENALKPKKILMIDDNEDFAFAMSAALSSFGHILAVSNDGTNGIKKFHKFKPDVVICDIGLPDMQGYDVARAILAERAADQNELFMIALSGYGQDADKKRAFEAGFNTHLTKPVDLERLLDLL